MVKVTFGRRKCLGGKKNTYIVPIPRDCFCPLTVKSGVTPESTNPEVGEYNTKDETGNVKQSVTVGEWYDEVWSDESIEFSQIYYSVNVSGRGDGCQ